MNRLQQLQQLGQSIWLDFISRDALRSGELAARIESGVLGMTSNPAIFEKSMGSGNAYDADIAKLAKLDRSTLEIYETLALEDIAAAAALLKPIYDRTDALDGYVSIEVSPRLARDTAGTVAEAKRLWQALGRPNIMIKIPGTSEGVPAIREAIASGINVNVTLLFGVDAYAAVAEAYLKGLEQRAAAGAPLAGVASVASFFVSRVDTEIDKRLDAKVAEGALTASQGAELKGKAAIANAKLAYLHFTTQFSGPRWDALRAKGAQVQRPLWASTSTKNPAYRDVIYVEELVGPDTVNTLPPATLDAFRDHGETRRTIDQGLDAATFALAAVQSVGVPLRDVTDQLLREGLAAFQKSFDTLLAGLETKAAALGRPVTAAR